MTADRRPQTAEPVRAGLRAGPPSNQQPAIMSHPLRIPKFLHELHGEEASVLSLVLVYSAALLLGVSIFLLTPDLQPAWHRWLLTVLALDIGGGVVANMTPGTSDYYAKRPKLRWIFILMHLIHPALIWLVFPGEVAIPVVAAATLVFTTIVNSITERASQRITGALFMVINLVLILLLKAEPIPTILLTLFSFKLIIGFAVRH